MLKKEKEKKEEVNSRVIFEILSCLGFIVCPNSPYLKESQKFETKFTE